MSARYIPSVSNEAPIDQQSYLGPSLGRRASFTDSIAARCAVMGISGLVRTIELAQKDKRQAELSFVIVVQCAHAFIRSVAPKTSLSIS